MRNYIHELSLKVLNLLYLLVKYGYYANLNDIRALMEPLISLLNGKNDKSHSGANSENFSGFNKVYTHVLYTYKTVIMSVIISC